VQAGVTWGNDFRCRCAFVEKTWIEEAESHILAICSNSLSERIIHLRAPVAKELIPYKSGATIHAGKVAPQ